MTQTERTQRWTIWLNEKGEPVGIRGAFLTGDGAPQEEVEVVPLAEVERLRAERDQAWSFADDNKAELDRVLDAHARERRDTA